MPDPGAHTEALREALGQPQTYPPWDPDGPVPERIETHLSLVGLCGDQVYKVKKPVDLGFVDFTALEARRAACRDEVRLNRRLAPDVYRGVVPVVRTADGALRLDGQGPVVDWAVQMRRLPDAWRLGEQLDDLDRATLAALGRRIARFHAEAARSERIATFATPEAVSANARQNFAQTREHVGPVVHGTVWGRLRERTESLLASHHAELARRVREGRPCETHGDLRLEHVYRRPDGSFVVLDAVEFAERYRHADPISDVAFLTMELHEAGRPRLARAFVQAWSRASNDPAPEGLLDLYQGYRAIVRAKVHGIVALDQTRPDSARESARVRARRLWLLALGFLEVPERRPGLVLVGGLPGVGKSTLARGLADALGAEVLRSDVIRKELAGLHAESRAAADFGEGLYTAAWDARTYGALLDRAGTALRRGERVILDASFRRSAERDQALQLALDLGVPAWFLRVDASQTVAEARIRARSGDASDADVDIHRAARGAWERSSARAAARTHVIDADRSIEDMVADAEQTLARRGLPGIRDGGTGSRSSR